MIFYSELEPAILQSFKMHNKIKDIRGSYHKNGTLVIRGDAATPEYQHVIDVISSVLEEIH
ncbi:MAG: hypothetical protein ACKO7N_01510 [Candidatus Nitrosotenuis sp.]